MDHWEGELFCQRRISFKMFSTKRKACTQVWGIARLALRGMRKQATDNQASKSSAGVYTLATWLTINIVIKYNVIFFASVYTIIYCLFRQPFVESVWYLTHEKYMGGCIAKHISK